MNLSVSQENELIDLMWKVMGVAAGEVWGFSATQLIEQEKRECAIRSRDSE